MTPELEMGGRGERVNGGGCSGGNWSEERMSVVTRNVLTFLVHLSLSS